MIFQLIMKEKIASVGEIPPAQPFQRTKISKQR
jgi:hypothetical protein